jgi:hypothetical protein
MTGPDDTSDPPGRPTTLSAHKTRDGADIAMQAPAKDDIPSVQAARGAPPVAGQSTAGDVADFVRKMRAMAPAVGAGRGRLVFAMDATMSRQPTWDMALTLQGEMFSAVKAIGGLDVQLVYFRGFGECRASKWVSDPDELARLMTRVSVAGGQTQIGKVLAHARAQAAERRISALVFVGDCVEEPVDDLCHRAGELGVLGVPTFLFQEGHDLQAERAFQEIARLTRGAWCRFDAGAAAQLRDLLSAVAVYAAGGRKALAALADGGANTQARRLLIGMSRH